MILSKNEINFLFTNDKKQNEKVKKSQTCHSLAWPGNQNLESIKCSGATTRIAGQPPPPYKIQFMFLYVYRFISSIRSWLDVKYIKILLFIIKFQYDLVSKNLLELQNSKKGHLQLISLNLELKRNLFGKIFLKPSIKSINKKTLQILTYNQIKICQKKSHYNLT